MYSKVLGYYFTPSQDGEAEECMKLNYRRTFFVGLAFMSICAFWQLYDNIIPLMLKDTFQKKETFTGVVMALDNILALFLLPFFGTLSDKVKTPLGKRTPFIVIGTVAAVIAMSFLPYADNKENFLMFLIALGFVLIAMGSYRSPTVALMPDITPKPLRSKANAIINLMGALGGLTALQLNKLLVKRNEEGKPDYTNVFLAVSALMIIAVIILLLTIRERKLAAEIAEKYPEIDKEESGKKEILEKTTSEKSKAFQDIPSDIRKSLLFILASIFLWFFAYNAVTSAYSRYTKEVWGLGDSGYVNSLSVAMVAAILSYIPIGFVASAIGRKKTIIIGILMMTASYFCGALFLHYSAWINVVFIFTGIGWAAINVNSYPMVVEMCKGADIGKYTGIYYLFSMSSQIATPIVSGALLEHVSYHTLFPYAVIFSLASLCTMLFVRHGDSKPPRKKNIVENFDVED